MKSERNELRVVEYVDYSLTDDHHVYDHLLVIGIQNWYDKESIDCFFFINKKLLHGTWHSYRYDFKGE